MDVLEGLQGTWLAVWLAEAGRKRAADEAARTRLTVSGGGYTLQAGELVTHGAIAGLDPARKHGAVDFVPEGRGGPGGRSLGLYALGDDELAVCLAAPGQARPTSFAPVQGGGHMLFLLRRYDPSADAGLTSAAGPR
jgi:uncharacterized protein (TIGR03067 family)